MPRRGSGKLYPASRGPSIFLDKSGRSKGLCSQGRKVEAKAESSGLCQSCTAEGVRVSLARERKTSTGFNNSTDTVFAEIVLHSLPNENRRNVDLPQNDSSYGLAPK